MIYNFSVDLAQAKEYSLELEKMVISLLSLSESGTQEHNLFTVMLGYAYNTKVEWMFENPQLVDEALQICERTVELLEPFALDPMGAYPRLFACLKIGTHCKVEFERVAIGIKIKEYELRVLGDENETLHGIDLFSIPENLVSDNFMQYQRDHTWQTVKKIHDQIRTQTLKKFQELRTNQLKAAPSYAQITEMLKSTDLVNQFKALAALDETVSALITLQQFKQALHLLAIGMHYTVKIRRSLPEEDRPLMNVIQCNFSRSFSTYGITLVESSMTENNDSYTELTELIEDGMEIYTSQFPITCPTTTLEIKKVMTRALTWNKRAIELCLDRPGDVRMFKTLGRGIRNWIKRIKEEIVCERFEAAAMNN